jgi:hypothetical protein
MEFKAGYEEYIRKEGAKQAGKLKIFQWLFKNPTSADPLTPLPRFPFRILTTISASIFFSSRVNKFSPICVILFERTISFPSRSEKK